MSDNKTETPKARKKVTMTFIVDADVNQNEFKNWVKSCPFSADGDQTVTWENLNPPSPAAAAGEVTDSA